jgi:hypothetical protein
MALMSNIKFSLILGRINAKYNLDHKLNSIRSWTPKKIIRTTILGIFLLYFFHERRKWINKEPHISVQTPIQL